MILEKYKMIDFCFTFMHCKFAGKLIQHTCQVSVKINDIFKFISGSIRKKFGNLQ